MKTTGIKITLALPVTFLMLVALAACGETVEKETETTFRTTLSIRNTAGGEQTVFDQGEDVEFSLRVTNVTNTAATVVSGSSQISDFSVWHSTGGDPVWVWSYGRAFATVVTNTVLAPWETVTMTATWDQTDIHNSPVPVGNYSAQGLMVHEQWSDDETGLSLKAQLISGPEWLTIK